LRVQLRWRTRTTIKADRWLPYIVTIPPSWDDTTSVRGLRGELLSGIFSSMADVNDSHRLIQLLYLRDRTMRKMRRSTDLREVWNLYQEMKLLNLHIGLLEREPAAAAQ
jgi:hypothetical protein